MRASKILLAVALLGGTAYAAPYRPAFKPGFQFLGTVPLTLYAQSLFDTFNARTAVPETITGRTTDLGSATWATSFLSGSNANPIIIPTGGNGQISGAQGTNPYNTFVSVARPVTTRNWYRTEVNTPANAFAVGSTHYDFAMDLNVGASTTTYVALTYNGAASMILKSVSVTNSSGAAAVLGGNLASYINLTALAGDNLEVRTLYDGTAATTYTILANGRQVSLNVADTAGGNRVTHTGTFGLRGFIGATALNEIEAVDPDTQATIRLYQPNHVVATDSDGLARQRLTGDFTMAVPGNAVQYRVVNSATGAAVVDWTTPTTYTTGASAYSNPYQPASALSWSLVTSPFTPPTNWFVEVRRSDLIGGKSITARGPIQSAVAHMIGFVDGQSLGTRLFYTATTGGTAPTVSAPSNVTMYEGTVDVGNGSSQTFDARRDYTPPANLNIDTFFARLRSKSAFSSVPFGVIAGGKAQTSAAQRLPGAANVAGTGTTVTQSTGFNNDQLEGILHAGGFYTSGIVIAGEYDAFGYSPATPANLIPNLQTAVNDNETAMGRTAKMLMSPVGSIYNAASNNAVIEATRYNQWKATKDYPTRYVLGPYKMHLQHHTASGAVDTDGIYHPDNSAALGFPELAVLLADGWSYMQGNEAFDGNGPVPLSATRSSGACTVTVNFDLNGLDGSGGLTLLNGAVYGNYRGGLRFAKDIGFGTPIFPTGAPTFGTVIGTLGVAGTTQTVTWPMACADVAATVYVSGPYGGDPFNPNAANTSAGNGDGPGNVIAASMQTKASMLGAYRNDATQMRVVQPFYQTSGVNYMTAS